MGLAYNLRVRVRVRVITLGLVSLFSYLYLGFGSVGCLVNGFFMHRTQSPVVGDPCKEEEGHGLDFGPRLPADQST